MGDQVLEQDLLAVTAAIAQPLRLGLPRAGRRERLTPVAPGLAAVRRGSHAPTVARVARVGEAGVVSLPSRTSEAALAGGSEGNKLSLSMVRFVAGTWLASHETRRSSTTYETANMLSDLQVLCPLTFAGVR